MKLYIYFINYEKMTQFKYFNELMYWLHPQTCTQSYISYCWLLTNMMQGINFINAVMT